MASTSAQSDTFGSILTFNYTAVWIEVLTTTKNVDMQAQSIDAVVRMMENALADYACESRHVLTVEKDVSYILTGNAIQLTALEVGSIVADLIDKMYPVPTPSRSSEDTNMEDRDVVRPLIDEDVARSLWKAVVSMTEKSMAPVRDVSSWM
jgi:hypothetical protein